VSGYDREVVIMRSLWPIRGCGAMEKRITFRIKIVL
jgi:hypothetical protein